MEDLLKFLNTSGLEASQDKYQLCVFSRDSNITSREWTLWICDIVVEFKPIFKLLGLQFQNTLNALSILSYLKTTWRGADSTVLLRLYKASIRSRMEYGGFLFHLLSRKMLKKLTVIQNKALRLAMGYRQSTLINIMLAESKETPVYVRFQYLCMNF